MCYQVSDWHWLHPWQWAVPVFGGTIAQPQDTTDGMEAERDPNCDGGVQGKVPGVSLSLSLSLGKGAWSCVRSRELDRLEEQGVRLLHILELRASLSGFFVFVFLYLYVCLSIYLFGAGSFLFRGSCMLFSSCNNRRPCKDCITGSQQTHCTCSINYASVSDNVLRHVDNSRIVRGVFPAANELECKRLCLQNGLCKVRKIQLISELYK